MAGSKVTTAVEAAVAPIVAGLGIDLVEVEYVKEGRSWYLRLYIDKKGGISLDDCELVHNSVNDIIDELDPITGPYIFEVSSPGLDRPLKTQKDFDRYAGEKVDVNLYAPENGSKTFTGILVGLIDGKIVISPKENEQLSFDEKSVALVKRVIEF